MTDTQLDLLILAAAVASLRLAVHLAIRWTRSS